MKHFYREICSLVICLVIVSGFISLFFRYLEQEKQRVDYYAFIPERADAILRIKEKKTGIDITHTLEMEHFIPPLFRKLIEQSGLNEWTFSFHGSDVACYVKSSPKEAVELNKTLSGFLSAYPPQIVCHNGIQTKYYADSDSKFFGSFHNEGYWIASYSQPLLAKILNNMIHTGETPSIYSYLKNMDGKSGADIWIYAPLIDIDILQSDSTHWSISQQWMQADLYRKGNNIIAFSSLPQKAYDDSTAILIADSLRNRVANFLHLSKDSLSVQQTQDDKNFYLRFELSVKTFIN